MTLVAAMNCGDSILMGCDSLVRYPQIRDKTSEKLWRVPGMQVVYGFAGLASVGFEFVEFATQGKLATKANTEAGPWRGFAGRAGDIVSLLNGRYRTRLQLSQAPNSKKEGMTLLMAGYIDGVAGIWELTDDGEVASAELDDFAAIGSAEWHATLARKTLLTWANWKQDARTMAALMDVAVTHAPECEGPVKLVKITRTEVVELEVSPDGKCKEGALFGLR